MRNKVAVFAIALVLLSLFSTMEAYNAEKIFFAWEKENGSINFTALCDANNYTWDFGDGSIGYGKNVSHEYMEDGMYTIHLFFDGNEIEKTIYTNNEPPEADFYWLPPTPYSYEEVMFIDNSTDDGYIVNWTWDFENDGIIDGYGKSILHVFTSPGTHDVTLRVIDDNGSMDALTKQISVLNLLPVPKFYWTESNNTIIFNASWSYDRDGYIVNYTWDFGDGSTGYGKVVSHEYSASKNYMVTLTVRDDFGEENSTTLSVDISNKLPRVNFYWSPLNPTDMDRVYFYSTSNDVDGNITQYIWNFGDGNTGYGRNVSHMYSNNGIYNITLTVIDNDMAYNISHKFLNVRNIPPSANFSYSPSFPLPNESVYFNSTSYDVDGYIVNYTWDFGDGSTGYGRNVSHVYTTTGIYNITLIVKDDDGDEGIKKVSMVIADIYVNKTMYNPSRHIWNNIADAIDNATSGSFIYVMKGIYNENVRIDKAIHMLGENATVSGTNYSIWIDSDDVILKSFAITNAGLIITSNHSLIENCVFYNTNISLNISGCFNRIRYNGIGGASAIHVYGDGNLISNNTINGGREGILVKGKMNHILSNEISSSYGVVVKNSGNYIEGNKIHECVYGLKISSESWVENNTIYDNTYGIFGNIFTIGENEIRDNIHGINATSATINGANITGNEVSIEGGNFVLKNTFIEDGMIEGITFNFYNGVIENASIMCNSGRFENSLIYNCSKIEGKFDAFHSQFKNNDEIMIYNATIALCNFTSNGIIYSNSSTWLNSSFNSNVYGLFLYSKNYVKNCSFMGNNHGIFVNGSKNLIDGNEITGNDEGIKIYLSHSNTIFNNSIGQNTFGLVISFSTGNLVSKNKLCNNTYNIDVTGDKIKYFYNNFDGNTINSRPVIYKINGSDLTLQEEYGFIGIVNCKNVTILNQHIEKNGKNIIIVNSSNINIENSKTNEGMTGIYIFKSNLITIKNSSIYGNNAGISIISSYKNYVGDCRIYGNIMGMKIFDIKGGNGNNIISSRFYNNNIGIYIYRMKYNEIRGNIDSIKIDGGEENTIMGNVSNLEIRNGRVSIINSSIKNVFSFSSNISMNNCILNGVSAENNGFNARGCNFTGEITYNNCLLNISNSRFISANFSIQDSNMDLYKIMLQNSKLIANLSNGKISLSKFYNESMLILNGNITVWNSSFYENKNGLLIINGSIYGGEIYNNTRGCVVEGAAIIEKVLFHHNQYGMILNSSRSVIKECSFWKNFYGIIANSGGNEIYHNNFIYNIKSALDYSNNTWNLTYPDGGNYWDDYAGVDEKHGARQNESGGDGIGDMPYIIGKSKDFYPLMEEYENASSLPNKPPIASFQFYPAHPHSFENIVFVDTSYDENGPKDIVNYTWQFGDGSIAYTKNPIHIYAKPGEYNVTLVVTDKAGEKGERKISIEIANIPPVANFTWEPKNATSYTKVKFYSRSYDEDGVIANYTWDFGDGNIAYGRNVTHTYTTPGKYNVALTVTDDLGGNSTVVIEIAIKNSPPSPDFEIYPEKLEVGKKITFKDLSTDIDGRIVEWHWDFGDGSASNERNATHVYSKAGKYTIKLVVKDDSGAHASLERAIEIKGKETPGMELWILFIAILVIMRKFK